METRHSAPWVPAQAAEYASRLRRDPNVETKVSHGIVGELMFDNALSRRLFFDPRMETVWNHLNDIDTTLLLQGPLWKHFLVEVQDGARGPQGRDLRSFAEVEEDITSISKSISTMKRYLRRYSSAELTVGMLYGQADIFQFFDESEKSLAMRNDNLVPLDEVLEKIPSWIRGQQSLLKLIKSPNHPDTPYHYFARKMYSFFHYLDENFNQWSLLARICNVTELFAECDSNKVRGTCRDMAEEFRQGI